MKKGKSIFLLLLVFGFLICITACDSTNNSNSSEIQIVNSSTDNKDVSIEVVNTKKIKDDISVDIKWNNTSSKIIEYGKAFSVYYLDGNDWKTVDRTQGDGSIVLTKNERTQGDGSIVLTKKRNRGLVWFIAGQSGAHKRTVPLCLTSFTTEENGGK